MVSTKSQWKHKYHRARTWLRYVECKDYHECLDNINALLGHQKPDRIEDIQFFIREAFKFPQHAKHFKRVLAKSHGRRVHLP